MVLIVTSLKQSHATAGAFSIVSVELTSVGVLCILVIWLPHADKALVVGCEWKAQYNVRDLVGGCVGLLSL